MPYKKRKLSKRQGIRLLIASKQKWKCKICFEILEARFEIDHIIPLSQGGQESKENLQALCSNCHSKKTMMETLILADKIREEKTGKSKYFDPYCYSVLI